MSSNADARPVLVAFDGSPEAVEAVRTAARLCPGHLVLVVTVWEPGLAMAMTSTAAIGGATYMPPSPEQMEVVDEAQREHAQATAQAGVKLAAEAGATAEALPVEDSTDVPGTLVAIAEQRDAAALVVGSRGLGRVKSALLGSTSRKVLHHTRRPVVLVQLPEE